MRATGRRRRGFSFAWASRGSYTLVMEGLRSNRSAAAPCTRRVDALARWAILIGLSLYLVFCHGCHGDEDNELFATLEHQVTGAALP